MYWILPVELLADVLNCTLFADVRPELTDDEWKVVVEFHDRLTDLNPEAVRIAQEGE